MCDSSPVWCGKGCTPVRSDSQPRVKQRRLVHCGSVLQPAAPAMPAPPAPPSAPHAPELPGVPAPVIRPRPPSAAPVSRNLLHAQHSLADILDAELTDAPSMWPGQHRLPVPHALISWSSLHPSPALGCGPILDAAVHTSAFRRQLLSSHFPSKPAQHGCLGRTEAEKAYGPQFARSREASARDLLHGHYIWHRVCPP